jgi:hypothetical protein
MASSAYVFSWETLYYVTRISKPLLLGFLESLPQGTEPTMDHVSEALSRLRSLPDPLVYSIIAIIASGAVYSTIHHVENWRPRKTKRVKLKGVEGRKVEDCPSPLIRPKTF